MSAPFNRDVEQTANRIAILGLDIDAEIDGIDTPFLTAEQAISLWLPLAYLRSAISRLEEIIHERERLDARPLLERRRAAA
jgi:hypothetical protein